MLIPILGRLKERHPQKISWQKGGGKQHVGSTKRLLSCSKRPVLSCEWCQTSDPHRCAVGGLRDGAYFPLPAQSHQTRPNGRWNGWAVLPVRESSFGGSQTGGGRLGHCCSWYMKLTQRTASRCCEWVRNCQVFLHLFVLQKMSQNRMGKVTERTRRRVKALAEVMQRMVPGKTTMHLQMLRQQRKHRWSHPKTRLRGWMWTSRQQTPPPQKGTR